LLLWQSRRTFPGELLTWVIGQSMSNGTRIRRPAKAAVPHFRKLAVLALTVSLLIWPFPNVVRAAAGDLDPSFGADGKITNVLFGTLGDVALAITVQPDGKIVVAGKTDNGTGFDFALARYNSNGSLDSSFGSGGKVTTDFFGQGNVAVAEAVAIQHDGKIVVAGTVGNFFGLARYNANGSLDSTFGSGGKVAGPATQGRATSLVIQPDGKIVVGGDFTATPLNVAFGLVRYNADGTFDTSFGSLAKVTTDFSSNEDSILALALQPNGRIVAAGVASRFGQEADFALARYKPNGSLDKSFGTDGKLTTDFNHADDEAHAVALQPDGKILAAGRTNFLGPSLDFVVARYNSDGTLDSTFGSGGKVAADFGGFDFANGIAVQPNGKILVSGWTQNPITGLDFVLVRYDSNGNLDPSFGTGGLVTTVFFGEPDLAFAMVLQSDGKVVLAGSASLRGVDRFAIARYATSTPKITNVSVSGKTLFVDGDDFDDEAVVIINGKVQSTTNDEQNPTTLLKVKKGGKRTKPGHTAILQVRNTDGALSPEFSFSRPIFVTL
jgi:uncharacterized delta-60 repeat protein